MKLGVVDVGGGLRGIYAAGIFDFCIEQNIQFDCCIGVSAGSANITLTLPGKKGATIVIIVNMPCEKNTWDSEILFEQDRILI